jgi:hypothetical protein
MSHEPWETTRIGSRLSSFEKTRDTAIALLNEQLQRIGSDSRRKLHATVGEHAHAEAKERSEILTIIGQALLEAGRVGNGLDTLEMALATDVWDANLFQAVGHARRVAGDTAGALSMDARVFVDPATPDEVADSIRESAESAVGRSRWNSTVSSALTAMYAATLAEDAPLLLRPKLEVEDGAGELIDLRGVLSGRVTLVAFWSRYCAPSVNSLLELQRIANELDARGVGTVAVTAESPSQALQEFLNDRTISIPVYHDSRGAAQSTFNSWATPDYFMLDRSAIVRYAHVSLSDVLRQAEALQSSLFRRSSSAPYPNQ